LKNGDEGNFFYLKCNAERVILCVCRVSEDVTPKPNQLGSGTYHELCSVIYMVLYFIKCVFWLMCGPGSVVGIATGNGLNGPRIESRLGGEILLTCPDRPWGPPSPLYNGYRVFPRGKERPERDADPSPASSAIGHERVALYLHPPMDLTDCTEPQCLYKGSLLLVNVLNIRKCTL
jgi:hypothetical protein